MGNCGKPSARYQSFCTGKMYSGVTRFPIRTQQDGLAAARRVLSLEAEALAALADHLNDTFSTALDVIWSMRGRVIATGMGKSGHIGRKIAATLASTGTPAHFVHPAEASHGDLGMITSDDVVVALSNSGETPELADIVDYVKRFEIPMIAITSDADSALGRAATVVLSLPDLVEACPLGLAPTTSTTTMLALGDCLAVALFERRGFSSADFRALHPGGKLGRRLLIVSDLMHVGDDLPLVANYALMAEALIAMTAKGFGCVGVVGGDGRLEGVVTDGDLRRNMSENLAGRAVADIMTQNPKSIHPGALASEALLMMNQCSITNLFVVEDGRPHGILHVHDCLRAGVT